MGVRTMPYTEAEGKPQFAGMGSGGSGGGGGSYSLPTATASRLGGVKIGSGISVTSDGTISVEGGGGGGNVTEYTLTSVPSSASYDKVIDDNCVSFDHIWGYCKGLLNSNNTLDVFPLGYNDYEKFVVRISDSKLFLQTKNLGNSYHDIEIKIFVENLVKTN